MDNLVEIIPEEELKRVLSSDASAEIDGTSLTCLNYEPLAQLIPKHWTVIDFGCSYNAQSYYFKDHKRLISVDLPFGDYGDHEWHFERFMPKWCEFYEMTIKEWLKILPEKVEPFYMPETFAICGYVPAFQEVDMVRRLFSNLFIYYPSDKELQRRLNEKAPLA